MSELSPSGSGYPAEPYGGLSLLDRLNEAAGKQDTAVTNVKNAEKDIKDRRERIAHLQGKVREGEAALPGLTRQQQDADDLVNSLLLDLEKELHLEVVRIQPAGPVVQGGTAKFKAVHAKLPHEVKLSWDTGGAPFVEGKDDTITVETDSVAPGDYDISASLVRAAGAAAIDSPSVSTAAELSHKPK